MTKLIQFNKQNKNHYDLYMELLDDPEITNNVTSIFRIDNFSYVINNEEKDIGILRINHEMDNFSLDMGILSEYRNCGYGKEALKQAMEIIEILEENYNKIIIRTKYNNNAVINISRILGFTYDIEEIERCSIEGEEYLVLTKFNTKNKEKTMI